MTASAVQAEHVAPLQVSDTLAGVGTLLRLVVRRNRVRLVVWWVVIVGLFAYSGSGCSTPFPPRASSGASSIGLLSGHPRNILVSPSDSRIVPSGGQGERPNRP